MNRTSGPLLSKTHAERPTCECRPVCPLDQGKPRCEREIAGAIAGYCVLAVLCLGAVAVGAALLVDWLK